MNDPSLVCVASQRKRTRDGTGGQPEGSIDLIKQRCVRMGSLTVRYTRIAAHLVGISAAVCRREARRLRGAGRTSESVAVTSARAEDLPERASGIRKLLLDEEAQGASPEILALMAAAIRGADVVIAGPLTDDDYKIRGVLPHLADLASQAHRVLRPPAPLIGHVSFGQLARQFQYIQMSHQDARRLAAGAIDMGVLAQVLRKRCAESGEFAITRFGGHGLLWADNAEWEIDPIVDGDADEVLAADAFCTAWVVARRFQRAGIPQALASARNAAARAIAAGRSPRAGGST
jgi:hypothetical protein